MLTRLKKSVPFSQRLNDFIISKTENLKYELVNEEYDYDYLYNYYIDSNRFIINPNNNDNNIFGDSKINILFRVWHDKIHFENNYKFDLKGELQCYLKHIVELPKDFELEKKLLFAEIVGQTLFFEENNRFPDNQREFTIKFLKDNNLQWQNF